MFNFLFTFPSPLGKAPFSNSVSKSFNNDDIAAMTIQIPHFRVFKSNSLGGEVHAEFLIVVTMGNATNITLGRVVVLCYVIRCDVVM
jgi:hypothetical protein